MRETFQYVVQPGDTLFNIARRFGTTVQELVRINFITNPDLIYPGMVLNIPTTGPAPSPPPEPPPPLTSTCPTLSRGSIGPEVAQVQRRLTELGYNPGPIDGIFGPMTEEAVKAFQRMEALPDTGVVDQATWTQMGFQCISPPPPPPPRPRPCPVLSRGSMGPDVERLQRRLAELGFYSGPIDGIFGPRTEEAVKQFQRLEPLPDTGVVDHATWIALGIESCPL